MKVHTAVIPAAGLGTRFLPATLSVPKVMIPVLSVPAIHYAVQEVAHAGIQHIVIVVSDGQDAIRQYFEPAVPALKQALKQSGRYDILSQMRAISDMVDITYVCQDQQLGLGHAILTAKPALRDEPFAVCLPDDIILSESATIGIMMDIYSQHERSIIAVKEVPKSAVSSLGIVDPVHIDDSLSRIIGMIEKPSPEEAPSNLAIVGRYVLTPDVLEILEEVQPGALGEIQLTDAISGLLPRQEAYAYRFAGVHFDVGTPLGMLQASNYAALQQPGMASKLREWLADTL